MINLLPLSERRERHTDLLNYYTLTAGVITVIGVVAMAACLLLFDQLYQYNLTQLKNQKKTADGQVALYLDTEKQAKTLETDITSLLKAQSSTSSLTSLIRELQAVTPAAASIDSITLSDGADGKGNQKTSVTGKADSRRTVGEMQLALSASKYFKNVEIDSTALAGANDFVIYKISLDINYDKLQGKKTL